MLAEVFVPLALLGGLYSSYTDLKQGLVPNRLTFPLIALGFFTHLLYSLYSQDSSLLISFLVAFFSLGAAGYVLWLLGVLSAGDVKEFMFLAALVPSYPGFLQSLFSPTLPFYPFTLAYLINTFLAIFPFLFLWGLFYLSRERKFHLLKLDIRKYAIGALAVLGAYLFSSLTHSLGFFLLILVLFMLKPWQKALALGAVFIAYLGFHPTLDTPGTLALQYAMLLAIFSLAGVFLALLKVIRKHALTREVKISDLEGGMIAGEEIYIRDGEVIKEEPNYMEKAMEMLRGGRREMLVSTRASGVSREEVEKLDSLVREGRIEDSIKVKEKMPFAPVIFLGFVLSLILGDISLLLRGMV